MKTLADKLRVIVYISESSYGHVAESVICRGVSFLGHVSPLEPSSVVSLVESHPVIVEEIRRTSSSGRGEGCLYNDGITFSLCCTGVEQEGHDVPSFSEEPLSGLLPFGESELHLGHVAGFVYR